MIARPSALAHWILRIPKELLSATAMLGLGGLLPFLPLDISVLAGSLALFCLWLLQSLKVDFHAGRLLLPVLILASFWLDPLNRLFAMPLLFAVLSFPAAGKGQTMRIGALLVSLYALLVQTAPLAFIPEFWANLHSFLLALGSGHAVNWGPEAAGIHLLSYFILMGIARAIAMRKVKVLFGPLLLVLALLLTQSFWLRGLESAPVVSWGHSFAWLAILAVLSGLRGPSPETAYTEKRWPLQSSLFALLFLLLLTLTLDMGGGKSISGTRIAFREAGEWSWELGRHGVRPGPRMGGLLRVLESWGAEVSIVDDEELAAEMNWDLVFVIHPDEAPGEELQTSLERYLEKGGNLVVVGEHTNVHGIMHGVNALLKNSGIQLKDDSAIPALRGWNWNYLQRFLRSPATRNLKNANDLGISIGGSLELDWPAWPLVLGRQAFSDTGNPLNPRGKMGDNKVSWQERYGDVPLLAMQRVGKGHLCVIGDTSGLMSLSAIQAWPFYLDLVSMLVHRPGWLDGRLLLLLLFALATSAGIYALNDSSRSSSLILGSGLLLVGWILVPSQETPPLEKGDKLVWLNASHQPNWMIGSSLDWSVMSLAECLMNADLLPLYQKELKLEDLNAVELCVISGPAREFSKEESELLESYVRQGGRLVVSADARRGDPVKKLFGHFGLELLDVPLGTAPEALDHKTGNPLSFEFYEAWPFATRAPVDTLVSCWGFPIIVSQDLGKGKLIAIGDERFLSRYFIEGSSRTGKPLNTAARFLRDAAKPPVRAPQASPKEDAWQQRYKSKLNQAHSPRPLPPKKDINAAQDLIFDMLSIKPSHRPGDSGSAMGAHSDIETLRRRPQVQSRPGARRSAPPKGKAPRRAGK